MGTVYPWANIQSMWRNLKGRYTCEEKMKLSICLMYLNSEVLS